MISSMSARRPIAAAGLVVLLTSTGILHFAAPTQFDAIVPQQLPGSAHSGVSDCGSTCSMFG